MTFWYKRSPFYYYPWSWYNLKKASLHGTGKIWSYTYYLVIHLLSGHTLTIWSRRLSPRNLSQKKGGTQWESLGHSVSISFSLIFSTESSLCLLVNCLDLELFEMWSPLWIWHNVYISFHSNKKFDKEYFSKPCCFVLCSLLPNHLLVINLVSCRTSSHTNIYY